MDALLEGEEQLKVKRSESRPGPRDKSGIRDEKMYDKAIKKQDKHRKLHKVAGKYGGRSEGDHHIPTAKPKHLFSGKRGIGSTDRR